MTRARAPVHKQRYAPMSPISATERISEADIWYLPYANSRATNWGGVNRARSCITSRKFDAFSRIYFARLSLCCFMPFRMFHRMCHGRESHRHSLPSVNLPARCVLPGARDTVPLPTSLCPFFLETFLFSFDFIQEWNTPADALGWRHHAQRASTTQSLLWSRMRRSAHLHQFYAYRLCDTIQYDRLSHLAQWGSLPPQSQTWTIRLLAFVHLVLFHR